MRISRNLVRRVAILGVLATIMLQGQLGAATVASTYDEAYSSRVIIRDVTGGGYAIAQASASKSTGKLSALADVSSDAPGGTPAFDLGIGENHSRAYALVKQYFSTTQTTAVVTATVDVTKLDVPPPVSDENAELNRVRTDDVDPRLDPRLGSWADNYAVLVLHAFYAAKGEQDQVNQRVDGAVASFDSTRRIGESDIVSFPGSLTERNGIELRVSVVHPDGQAASSQEHVLVVTLLLEVSARAWGEAASAFAECQALVRAIGIA